MRHLTSSEEIFPPKRSGGGNWGRKNCFRWIIQPSWMLIGEVSFSPHCAALFLFSFIFFKETEPWQWIKDKDDTSSIKGCATGAVPKLHTVQWTTHLNELIRVVCVAGMSRESQHLLDQTLTKTAVRRADRTPGRLQVINVIREYQEFYISSTSVYYQLFKPQSSASLVQFPFCFHIKFSCHVTSFWMYVLVCVYTIWILTYI